MSLCISCNLCPNSYVNYAKLLGVDGQQLSRPPQQQAADDYDMMSATVRGFCTERLRDLEKALRPYVDGSFGEIERGHLSGYLSVLKELKSLWRAQHRPVPRDTEPMMPVAAVEKLMLEAAQAAQAEREAAVAEAVAAAQARMVEAAAGQRELSVTVARQRVDERLRVLLSR